jgi:hypothetical protein
MRGGIRSHIDENWFQNSYEENRILIFSKQYFADDAPAAISRSTIRRRPLSAAGGASFDSLASDKRQRGRKRQLSCAGVTARAVSNHRIFDRPAV